MKIIVAALAFVVILVSPAQAATWKQVTASGGASIDQVGLARTADGVLHVVWKKDVDLFHSAIGPDGKLRVTTPIVSGWASLSDPAITVAPGGLRVAFGGIRTTESTETNQDMNSAFSSDGGASWQLQVGSVVAPGGQSYASDAGIATLANGTPLITWAGTLGTWVHAGLDPATPNFNYMAPIGNYGYDPGIAADLRGGATLAWFSNETNSPGVLAQSVADDGSPLGQAVTMPGSRVMVGGSTLSRTPIVQRAKSLGMWVAYGVGYPTADQVRLWLVGANGSSLIARTRSSAEVAIAADSKGRLWVAWSDGQFGDQQIYAARSNPTSTVFGEPVKLGAVKGAHSTYSVDASATDSGLDVLANFAKGSESTSSTFTTRVLPGLTLKGKRSKGKATFTVTDAGTAVKGAKVKLSGRSGKTDSKGHVTLTASKKGTATASAAGYTKATLKLK